MRGLGGLGSNRVRLVVEGDERTAQYVDRDSLEGVEKRGSSSGYDRIVMNPPFGDRRDAEHVQHAYSLLKPGGRVVAIMGEGVFFGQDKKAVAFREWLESVGGTSEKLPDGSFQDPTLPVNTGVAARMVVVDRPSDGSVSFNATIRSLGNPLDTATLESVISRITAASPSHWGRDTVVIAPTFSSLPVDVIAKAKREGYDAQGRKANGETVSGVTYDGKVYVVQENISSELEAEETLLHERLHQIVHGNPKDPEGIELRQQLGRLYTKLGARTGIERMAKDLGIKIDGPISALKTVAPRNQPAFLAEEFLAHAEGARAYEKLPERVARAIREFYGQFRDWLRGSKFARIAEAMGVQLGDFTKSDLAWTLKGIRQQEAGTGSKAIRFMTAYHGSKDAVSPASTFKPVNTNSTEFKRWFGDWEIAALEKSMRRSRGSDQARKEAAAFIGKPLRNRETGVEATVSNGAFGKMLSKPSVDGSVTPQAHMQALGNIDKLFELATLDAERTPKKTQDAGDIGNVQHYKVPMPFDGDVLLVKMMVKQFIDPEKGNRLYLVQAVEIENAGIVGEDPVVSGQFQSGASAESSPPSGVNQRLAQMIAAVKNGASKVVDADGKPLIVYHGTDDEFTAFEVSAFGTLGSGIYMTESAEQANAYGENTMPLYVSIKSPWVVNLDNDSQGSIDEDFDSPSVEAVLSLPNGRDLLDAAKRGSGMYGSALKAQLVRLGFDGIIGTYPDGSKEIVAFNKTQVKSADLNTGEFSDTNPSILYSKGDGAGTGTTPEQVRAAFVKAFGGKTVRQMEENGLIHIVATADDLPYGLTVSSSGKAFWHEGTGKAYFIADRMSSSLAHRELLHEIGEHAGLETMLGEKGYNALIAKVKELRNAGDKDVVKAWNMVLASYVNDPKLKPNERLVEGGRAFMHEVLAKVGEVADIQKQSWWRDIINAVKAWLIRGQRFGFTGMIKVADIQDMVMHSLKVAAKGKPGPKGGISDAYGTDQMKEQASNGMPLFSKRDRFAREAFAAEFLRDLAVYEPDMFRYPTTKASSVPDAMYEVFPDAEYFGDHVSEEDKTEKKADHRFVFKTPDVPAMNGNPEVFGKQFDVYVGGNRVWIDVHRSMPGEQGSRIYSAVADYAFNTRKVFGGDPVGVSFDAIKARNKMMLASALKHGVTRHLDASLEQERGSPDEGIEPLDWSGTDVEKITSLIHTIVKSVQNMAPKIKDYYYDFNENKFAKLGKHDIGTADVLSGLASNDNGRAWSAIVSAVEENNARAAGIGAASGRAAIIMQSLISAESRGVGDAGILQAILDNSSGLINGGMRGMFSKGNYLDDETPNATLGERVKAAKAALIGGPSVKNINGWWHKTVGTMYHIAETVPEFKPVFVAVQRFIRNVSMIAMKAEAKAPSLLPKGFLKRPISPEDTKAIADPIHDQRAPRTTGGITGPPASVGGMRVRTITITAPQQGHGISARSLTNADARTGTNFSSRCSNAIKRLQLGCRKPKLRARRKLAAD